MPTITLPSDSPLYKTTDDWQICSIGGAAGANVVGGGVFIFSLGSPRLNVYEPVFFYGSGLGSGGNFSSFDLSTLKGLDYDPISDCKKFSIFDLHLTFGSIVSAGVAAIVVSTSYSVATAKDRFSANIWTKLASNIVSKQGSKPIELGAFAFLGVWYSYSFNGNSINPDSAASDFADKVVPDRAPDPLMRIW